MRTPAALMLTSAAAVALSLSLLIAGCGPGAAASPTSAAASSSSLLSGVSLTGQHVNLEQERGHPVVLIFWGAWCGPCHDEQPALNQQYAHWAPHGVVFLGVDMRDDPGAAESFVQQEHVPYPSVADPDATIAANFHVPAAPALVFVNEQGQIGDTILGGLGVMSGTDFDSEVRSLFPAGVCAGC